MVVLTDSLTQEGEEAPPAEDTSEGSLVKNGSTSILTVSFTCDDDLTDYALGGCILTCSGVQLTTPPAPWVDLSASLTEADQ